MKPLISTHRDFDDARYWRFERSSVLPLDYFRDPADAVRAFFVRWRWFALLVGIICIALLAYTDSGLPNL